MKIKSLVRSFLGGSFIVGALGLTLTALSLSAGNYSQNFEAATLLSTNLGDGSTITSTGSPNLCVNSLNGNKFLTLSEYSANIHSALLLPDLDSGTPVGAFSASWTEMVQANFSLNYLGGEGFSFNFGQLAALPLAGAGYNQEDGFGTGLSVGVRTKGTNSPGFYLRVNGTVITNVANVPLTQWGLNSTNFHAFQVTWNADTGLTLKVDGSTIFTNVATPGFTPQAGDRCAWAAHTSTTSAVIIEMDDIVVNTGLALGVGLPLLTNSAAAPSVLPQIAFTANVDPRGLATTVIMEVGTNTSYGTGVTNLIAANTNGLAAFAGVVPVSSFDRVTPLHGRIRVSNALGSVTGPDIAFSSTGFELTASHRLGNMAGDLLWGDGILWMDADNDGALDLAMIGSVEDSSALRANVLWNPKTPGATNWAVMKLPLGGGIQGSISVGDLDNDNQPDSIWASDQPKGWYGGNNRNLQPGGLGTRVAHLLAPVTGLSFPLGQARSVIRDFDHDGKQDVFMTGAVEDANPYSTAFSWMFHNVFSGTATAYDLVAGNTSIPKMGQPSDPQRTYGNYFVSSGYLNADGFSDLYAFGQNYNYGAVHGSAGVPGGYGLYRNNHEMDFDTVFSGPTPYNNNSNPEYFGGAASVWADFNGDGHDDLLICESGYYNSTNRILLNDGAGHLIDSGIVLPALGQASVAAGDIFNHGRNDIVITGRDLGATGYGVGYHAFVLRNNGDGTFTPFDYGFDQRISKTGQGVALADYDNDGRLDIAIIGGSDGSSDFLSFLSVYRNELAVPTNHPPTAPGGLSTVVGPGTVTFTWGSATDDITPANLLTYNLRVGTNSLGTQTISPLADVTTGWRKIPAPGNCGHCFSTVYHFPPGTYYWSVQAIDGIFAGGAWATEGTFTITQPERPLAYIAHVASQNTVAWPARFPDYTLQRNSTLTTTNWTTVTNSPLFTNGKLTVNVTNAPPSGFFRLMK